MEDRSAAMPAKPTGTAAARSTAAADRENRGALRLQGTVPAAVLHSGNAAYLFGWVAFRRGLALLGRWLGVRRQARMVIEPEHCTYVEELNLLGTGVKSSEEVIPWSSIESVEWSQVSGTWPVILGALILLVGGSWGLLRIAEGVFGKDMGILAKGVGILVFSLALDMLLTLVASRFLARRWQVIIKLTSGTERGLEVSSHQDLAPLRARLRQNVVHRNR